MPLNAAFSTLRLLTAAALVGTLAVTMTGAHAAPPTLDGKKVKTLTLKAASGVQDHDADLATDLAKDPLGSVDRTSCVAPRCAALTFVYKPAKGVRADIGFAATWTNPATDIDLYVAEVGKGFRTQVESCGASAGTSEKVVLPYGTLKAGKTYALVVDFYRAANDTVTATVTLPNKVVTKKTLPEGLVSNVNCGL